MKIKSLSLVVIALLLSLTIFACNRTEPVEVKSIAVTAPNKVHYAVGEDLDLTGAKIHVKYEDNKIKNKELLAEHVTGYNKNTAGDQVILVNFKGQSATFTVSVYDKIINNADQLKNALNTQQDGEHWAIASNITNFNESVEITKQISINGLGNAIEFSNFGGTSHNSAILLGADNIELLNLTSKINNNEENWQGRYAIQVYNSKNVLLANVSAHNGDGGILINSSQVALRGRINVSGNEYGGIEVSKSSGVEFRNSTLTITANVTLINETESATAPTLWLEDDEGEIIGGNFTEVRNEEKEQTYFFIGEVE